MRTSNRLEPKQVLTFYLTFCKRSEVRLVYNVTFFFTNQKEKADSSVPVMKRNSLIRAAAAGLLMIAVSSCGGSPSTPSPPPADVVSSWLQGSGNDLHNTRWQASETAIGTTNVASLAAKWVATVAGDVSATPTTDGTSVYFPDWGGYLNALSSSTGAVIW